MSAVPLAHCLEGNGPLVALLNGGMMTFPSWEPVATRLRERHRVLRFDFRGQLLSPGRPPEDLAGHAADAAALLEALAVGPAHVLGTSFGAEVALELAAAHPQRVRSLALITAMDCATAEFRRQSDGMRRTVQEAARGGDRGAFWDILVAGVYSAAYRESHRQELAARRAQLSQLPAGWFTGVDQLLGAIDGFDLQSRLPAVRCPSLVVIAGDDQVMHPERSRALARALGAEVQVHPTAGHALVAEQPEWLADVCLEFLDRQPSSTPLAYGSRSGPTPPRKL